MSSSSSHKLSKISNHTSEDDGFFLDKKKRKKESSHVQGGKDGTRSYSFRYNQNVVHNALFIGPQHQSRVT